MSKTLLITVLLIICLIQGMTQTYKEIREKTYFKKNFEIIKNNSILWEKINGEIYTIIDSTFDIYYLITQWNYRKLELLLISIVLLMLFWWIPIIYSIIFLWNLLILVLRLSISFIINSELSIDCDDKFELLGGFYYLVKKSINRPKINLLISFYVKLSGKQKFEKKIFDMLLINNLLPKPLWFLKVLMQFAYGLSTIFHSSSFEEKNVFGKLDMLIVQIKMDWDWYLMRRCINNSFAEGKKIKINNRKLWTNFTSLNEIILLARHLKNPGLLESQTTNFKGKDHQAFLGKNNFGISYTRSKEITIGNQKIKTSFALLPNQNQFFVHGYFGPNCWGTPRYSKNFIKKHNIINEKSLEGLLSRNWYFLLNAESKKIIFQGLENPSIRLLDKEIPIYWHAWIGAKIIAKNKKEDIDAIVEKIYNYEMPKQKERLKNLENLHEIAKSELSNTKIPIDTQLIENNSKTIFKDINDS